MSEGVNKELRRMMAKAAKVPVITGTVKAVDLNGHTCDVDPADGGSTLFDVRLKVSRNGEDFGAFSVPKVGSKVMVAMIDNQPNNLAVISVEKIEEHVIRVDGGGEVRVKPNGVVAINGDDYGGVVKWDALKADLNKLKSQIAGLRDAVQNWNPVANDGGAALKVQLLGSFMPRPSPDLLDTIQSDKTKHGSL